MKSCPACHTAYPAQFAHCPKDGQALVDASAWAPGLVVNGKYKLLSKLGQGGMGSVFKAEHLKFGELRALKVMNPELAHDPNLAERFTNEAIVTRRLRHPNAVQVDDIDAGDDGRPFIVMEYIEGRPLKAVIEQEGALTQDRACALVLQIASALEAAHVLGLVHRDIKPENILLVQTPQGEQAKVLDFGIARVRDARLQGGGQTLTATGTLVGTPAYMSPEQVQGKHGDEIDGRSDLYSLGIVFYELLSGNLPFTGENTMAVMMAHLHQAPPPLRSPQPGVEIPAPIAALVNHCLAKDPADRPATARALIEEIAGALGGMPPSGCPAAAATTMAPPPTATRVGDPSASVSLPQSAPQPSPVSAATVVLPPAAPELKRHDDLSAPRPSRPAPAVAIAPGRSRAAWAAVAVLVVAAAGGLWWKHRQTPLAPSGQHPPVATTRARAATLQPVTAIAPTAPPVLPSPAPVRQAATIEPVRTTSHVQVQRLGKLPQIVQRHQAAKALSKPLPSLTQTAISVPAEIQTNDFSAPANTDTPAEAISSDPGTAYNEGYAALRRHDDAAAFANFRVAARAGDADAQAHIGLAFLTGRGTAPNAKKAVYWFRKSANQGWAAGEYGLGRCLQSGRGVQRNPRRAAQWYRKAASQGFLPAARALKQLRRRQRWQ